MIKFAQAGPDDTWFVFLGITIENLERIANKLEPIVFKADQVGLGSGSFAIGTGGMGAALREQLGAAELRSCLELTQQDADALVSGGCVERSLHSLGFSHNGNVMVLLGKTEAEIMETLRASGLVAPSTKVTELSSASKPRIAEPPSTRRIQPTLIVAGLVFVGLGALGVHIGKNAGLGVVIALGGVATIAWGFLYTPRSR